MFTVPQRFNRNSPTVTSIMTPEQSGIWLLERMLRSLGLPTLEGRRLLDFGCGVRFTQAILNSGLAIGKYIGVDVDREMIEYLRSAVDDSRFEFHFMDTYNAMYNPGGGPITQLDSFSLTPPVDVISMFSVVTHLYPDDCTAVLAILRRHVRDDGHLFFSCFLDDTVSEFEDRSPERNAGRCVYNRGYLESIVTRTGWRVIRVEPAHPPLIGDAFVCAPARVEPLWRRILRRFSA